jgi:chromosome segregation protein
MQICRLRLVGFKSFVDATELAIEPGLTGIVGPNGCGKSNLVEALRWAMGESSARRLRGGEMDDVIFAGTTARPARNNAEVALTIDNSSRDAPFAFNDREEIEVVRRIERSGGSTYRVNGREVRARDVQLLFADAASGAHSGAMVSQGRISALIEAKPAERRLLLEDAAGTAGLHARRRETELKLDAAEQNLERLDDVIATITAQFEGLKKQARQAQRYRRLAEHIRSTEALLFRARWLAGAADAERSSAELRAAERDVAEATERALSARRALELADTALPPLRAEEAAAAAELRRLNHARDALEQELQRVLAARSEAEQRLVQLAADLAHEEAQLAEADGIIVRLSEEERAIMRAETEAGPALEAANARLREERAGLAEAEAELQCETEADAAANARRAALERRRAELSERLARLEARRVQAERERESLAATLVSPEAVTAAAVAVAEAERRVGRCRDILTAAEDEATKSAANEEGALDAAREVETRLARLRAEAEGLRALLVPPPEAGSAPPVLAALQVARGFEAAVGAVFEDELLASLAEESSSSAPRFWATLAGPENGARLPEGARALGEAVAAPAALSRSLAQAGWVDSAETGRRLQPSLAPGQRLVDREGRLWRWDGFTSIKPGPSPAAQHLRHSNRLAVLKTELATAQEEVSAARHRVAESRSERQRASEADRQTHQQLREAEAALVKVRASEAELSRRAMTTETRLTAAVDTAERIRADLVETGAQAAQAEEDFAGLPDPGLARARLDRARAVAMDARRREAEARAAIDLLAAEAARRRERLSSIGLEERSWRKRAEGAAGQRAALLERQEKLTAETSSLAARPAEIAAESETLGAAIADAAASCRRASDALALGETQLREAVERSRLADQSLAEAREQLARAEVVQGGAAETLARLTREIRERLEIAPESLGELAGLAGSETIPDPSDTAARLDRLLRERDGMGPVNLMAESEATEVEARITGLQSERADLTEAIARLRGGIRTLDQEVRRRLTAAFDELNRHFAKLFARLFDGGKAHLALVENDDPLAAGLEIMASPPGKKLQSLSLLSGGEQALTALALLFAIFLTKPAPVCVLDEVDAALDDANVDRFCSLVAEIADNTGTRFLVVTHHRITMARVDRLFGVTMTERGISRLVSVDLARAARMRQTA